MPVEIRETIVTPETEWDVVQLHISDGSPEGVSPEIEIYLTARIPKWRAPLVAQVQRKAIAKASEILSQQMRSLGDQIGQTGNHHEPAG